MLNLWHNLNIAFSQVIQCGCVRIRLLEVLHREVDDGSTHLDGFVETGQEGGSLLDEHKCAELALVILEQEFASFELNLGVAAGH